MLYSSMEELHRRNDTRPVTFLDMSSNMKYVDQGVQFTENLIRALVESEVARNKTLGLSG